MSINAAFAAADRLFEELDRMRAEEIEQKSRMAAAHPVGSTRTLTKAHRLGCVVFPVGTEVEVEGCTAALNCYYVDVTVDGYEFGVKSTNLEG